MKYKIGDKVRVRPLSWFSSNLEKNPNGSYKGKLKTDHAFITEDMGDYCGKIVTISKITDTGYRIEEMCYTWSDYMFEDVEMEEVLIPFDVEKAKAGAKVVTDDGKPVRILCFDRRSKYNNLVCLVDDPEVDEVRMFNNSGVCAPYNLGYKLFIKELQPKQRTEFTMQEIADKLGVDVNELKIKK